MKTQNVIALLGIIALISGFCNADDLNVKWSYGMNHIGNIIVVSLKVSDFDGDGFNDIAVAAKEEKSEGSAGWVYMLNNDGTLKWEDDTKGGAVSAMVAEDLEGTGKKQIIAGVGNLIYLYNGTGLEKKRSLGDSTYKINSLVVDDINNDGKKELIVGAGSQEKGAVYIYDNNMQHLYDTPTIGSVSQMYVADINGDGLKEIIVGTIGRNDENPAYIQAFSSKLDKLGAYKTQKGVQSLAVIDMNGDGSQEIIAGVMDSLVILNSNGSLKEIKQNLTKPEYVFDKILVTDMGNDGEQDIIFGCSNKVYMYDQTLTNLRWTYNVGPKVFDMIAEDINGDGFKELAVGSDSLYTINKDGTQVYKPFNPNTNRFSVRDIYIGDINDDTYPEIIIGSSDGNVSVLSSTTHSLRIDANAFFTRGEQQFAEMNFQEAEKSFRAAMKAFQDLGDNTKASEVKVFLDKVKNEESKVQNQTGKADEYRDNAFTAFQDQDYMGAIQNATIAKAKYASINPKDPQINRTNNLIKISMETIGLRAENFLENASAYSESKDHTNALEYAKKAAESYAFIKDDAGLAKSQAIINASKQALGVTDETTPEVQPTGSSIDLAALMPLFISIAIFIIVVLISVLALKSRKTKKRAHPDEGSVLDKMEKERRHEKTHPKKVVEAHTEEARSQHREKHEKPKQWIKEAEDALKEPRKAEKHAKEDKDAHASHPHASHKHRKKLKRIAKDTYRGAGISLRSVSHNAPKEKSEE